MGVLHLNRCLKGKVFFGKVSTEYFSFSGVWTRTENKTKHNTNASDCFFNCEMNLLVHWAAVNQKQIRNLLVPGILARASSTPVYTMATS